MEQPLTEQQSSIQAPKNQKQRIRIILGICAAAAVLLALVAVALLFPRTQPQANQSDPTVVQTDPVAQTALTPTQTTSPIPANPFAPEDFRYEGDYLTCITAESVLGIDVSGYQNEIDWQQVAQAGVRFAMIRVGGRGWGTTGTLYDDSRAQANYEGAKQAGLQVGVYFFSQAITPEEAVEEAEYVLSYIKDWELELPVVYDWEYVGPEARTANMDARTLTDCTLAFCRTVENADREAMVYFNPTQSNTLLFLEELLQYPFWLAMYQDTMDYPHKVDMWQYTRKGRVPGIEGDVDINLYFPHNE